MSYIVFKGRGEGKLILNCSEFRDLNVKKEAKRDENSGQYQKLKSTEKS
jgi:hypothetical protein